MNYKTNTDKSQIVDFFDEDTHEEKEGLINNKVNLSVYLFVVSLIIPIFFFAGPLRLTPFFLILLAMFVPLCFLWVTKYAGPIILPDILILTFCLWASSALIYSHGLSKSIEPIGVIFVQTFGPYLLGRIFIRNSNDLKKVVILYAIILIFLFPFTIIETTTSRHIYLELFDKLGPTLSPVFKEPRWGMTRVQVAFEHPILFGIFSASLFPLAFYGIRGKKLRLFRLISLPVIVLSATFSFSTGALLCLFVQGGLIVWDRIFRHDHLRWRKLMLLCAAGYVIVDMISNRTPFNVFVDYLTFNSGTAYNRILIWEYGSAEVWRHPIFGIGLNEWVRAWWMSTSMDNFWLVIAVSYGIPAFLMLTLAFLIILIRVGAAKDLDETAQNMRKGILMSLVGVFVAIASVHLWNATYCWLMFLVGCTVWMINENPGKEPRSGPKLGNNIRAKSKSKYAASPLLGIPDQ